MELIIGVVLSFLMVWSNFLFSFFPDHKDVKENAVSTQIISKKYPLLSQTPDYQHWLRARTTEEKANIIGSWYTENFYCDPTICKNRQSRDDYFKEMREFLEENKKTLTESKYQELSGKLKKFEDELIAIKNRHALRHPMPPELEKAVEDRDAKFAVEYLDKHPEDIQAVDEEGNNLLMKALLKKKWNVPLIEQLIKKTKDVNAKNDEGETALHIAAFHRDKEIGKIIKLLVSKGAAPNARDNNDDMPIANAIRAGSIPATQALLKYKISLDKVTSPDHPIMTQAIQPLPEECTGCKEVHGSPEQEQIELLTLLAKQGADMNATNTFGETPLNRAIGFYNEPAVRFLLDHNAEIQGITIDPLTQAVMEYISELPDETLQVQEKHKKQSFAIIKLLLERGANPEGYNSQWPLLNQVLSYLPVVKLLVKHGASTQTAVYGQTPLDRARSLLKNSDSLEQKNRVEEVIEYLAKITPAHAQGKAMQEHGVASSALPHEVKSQKEIAAILEQFTAGPTKPSKITLNNIKRALLGDYSENAGNYHPDFDKIISEDVSFLQLEDEAKDTPLLLAIKYNKPDAVATILTLLESLPEKQKEELLPAVIFHKNEQGLDAYHLAQELGYENIITLLKPYTK